MQSRTSFLSALNDASHDEVQTNDAVGMRTRFNRVILQQRKIFTLKCNDHCRRYWTSWTRKKIFLCSFRYCNTAILLAFTIHRVLFCIGVRCLRKWSVPFYCWSSVAVILYLLVLFNHIFHFDQVLNGNMIRLRAAISLKLVNKHRYCVALHHATSIFYVEHSSINLS
jgi:uncharacterized protein with PQ loop repeat